MKDQPLSTADTSKGRVQRRIRKPRGIARGITASARARTERKTIDRPLGSGRAHSAPDALLQRLEAYLKEHALSPATVRNYLADLRAFTRWHAARRSHPTRFTTADFRAYREYLCHKTDQSVATINRRLQSLRLFGRFLYETGQASENPTKSIELVPNHHENGASPRWLSRAEVARLEDAVLSGRPSLVRRDHALLQLMLQAGLRVHEVAELRVRDLVSSGRNVGIEVHGNGRNGLRVVPLSPAAAQALREYLATRPAVPRDDYLFLSQRGRPLSMRAIQRVVDTYARAAGLKGVCAQSLRNTCAKAMLDATQDIERVAAWLGHQNPRTLERYSKR